IDGDAGLRRRAVTDVLPVVQPRRLVLLPLADHHHAVHAHRVQHVAHALPGRLARHLLVAHAHRRRRRQRRRLRHAHELQGQVAVGPLLGGISGQGFYREQASRSPQPGSMRPAARGLQREEAVALETYTSILRAGRCDYDRGVSDAALTLEARIPPSLAAVVTERLQDADRARVAERLGQGDATLWGAPGTPEIADRLGWLTIAERMLAELDDVCAFADGVRDEGIRDVVLLGMGGSSLAPEVLRRCFPSPPGRPALHVLDSTDAASVRAVGARVEIGRTLFVVSSKSGSTIEPLSLFAHFWALSGAGERFAAITDPGSGLEELARAHRFRKVFAGDPDIGGRYSALSAFGIVPGALMGRDVAAPPTSAPEAWRTRVRGAADGGAEGPDRPDRSESSAAIWLGAALSALAAAGRAQPALT